MKKGLPFFILAVLLIACTREEKNDLVWEKSSGRGEAYFIKATPDSGFMAAGQADGKPYFVKYNSKRDKISEIRGTYPGAFTSVWVCVSEDTDAFGNDADINYDGNLLLAGSLGGNFYLAIKAPLE